MIMRRERGSVICVSLLFITLAGITGAGGQTREMRRITGAVTYVATGSFYFDAGKLKGVAPNDTITVIRKSKPLATGIVSAVSSASSVAKIISQSGTIAVGDSILEVKEIIVEEQEAAPRAGQAGKNASLSQDNRVSGRIGLQYAAAGVFGTTLDFSQPALITQLSINRFFGTASTFMVYARTYRDMSAQYDRYGQGSRNKIRMFELSLRNDDPRSSYGYGVGRITSRYVGGLGVFDGGQFYLRQGNFSFGLLGGTQPDYTTSAFSTDESKYAGFVNYAWGGDAFKTSDITFAYGQQRYQGRIDRKFGYFQSSLRFGTDFFFYSSTEMDFAHRENGSEVKRPTVTNSFLTISWMPASWVSVNAGYDAVRALDLLESMKTFPDTLLDKSLKEGYRANLSFRLPFRVTLSGNANFRLASATTPSARTLGTIFRVSDIIDSDVNFGAGYQDIRGLYTTGNDWTLDMDRWIAQSFSISLRIDRYRYTITGQDQRITTTTGTVSMNYSMLRSFYTAVNFDQVWDTIRNTQRLYVEVGMHF
jgi:hypothetical protein